MMICLNSSSPPPPYEMSIAAGGENGWLYVDGLIFGPSAFAFYWEVVGLGLNEKNASQGLLHLTLFAFSDFSFV